MKIALMNNLYHPYNKGGAEFIVQMCYEELQRRNIEVVIITTKPYFKYSEAEQDNIYYLNSFYYYLNKIPLLLRWCWHLGDTLSFKKYFHIKKILKQENIDLVITHNLKGLGLLTPIAIKKNNAKHIHTLHDIQLLHPSGLMIHGKEKMLENWMSKLYQRINARLFRPCDIVISPSYWLLDLHKDKGFFPKSKKRRILNPPPSTPKKIPVNSGSGRGEFNFIYAGQIESQKGIFFLIKTFKEHLRLSPSSKAKLIIVGGGSQLQKIRRKEVSDRIIFQGKLNRENTIDSMNESDCLIVPSLCYENSPTVIYEAASLGLPVIASRIGGVPELIEHFGGALFEPNNSKDLIAIMKKTTETFCRRLNFNTKKKIEQLSSENYINELLAKTEKINQNP